MLIECELFSCQNIQLPHRLATSNDNDNDLETEMDMNMGYETDSMPECESESESDTTSDVECTLESEVVEDNDGRISSTSAFEPPSIQEELRDIDGVPIVNASRFRKSAYRWDKLYSPTNHWILNRTTIVVVTTLTPTLQGFQLNSESMEMQLMGFTPWSKRGRCSRRFRWPALSESWSYWRELIMLWVCSNIMWKLNN